MTENDKLNEYVSTKDAAKILQVTQRRVLQAIEEKRLDAVKVGGRWLVKRESLYKYKA